MKLKNISKSFNLIFPLIISFFVILLSNDHDLWLDFWKFLKISPQIPPFSDFDAVNRALLSQQQGFNPYLENPNDITQGKYMYPSIWLNLFEIFNLQNSLIFKIFSFFIIYFYIFILLDFIKRLNNRYFTFFLIVFFFSTTNFLILERLNIEVIIFCILYLAIVSNNKVLKTFYFFVGVFLKIFPFFSIFIFINKKKYFFFILLFSIAYFALMRNEIEMMRVNFPEYALIIAYGIVSITKGIYYYSVDLGYFINDENFNQFKYFMILLATIYSLSFFVIKFNFGEKELAKNISIQDQFFLCGGGIYIGTFLISASIDYRLIFLIFTIPYILKIEAKYFKELFFLAFVISINSYLFESGDPYALAYFTKSFIVHGMKVYIFTFLSYHFGMILNKYIKIKFNFLIR